MRASNLLFSLIGFFVATVNLAVGQQQTLQAVNANSFNLIQSNDTYSQEAVDVIINAFKKLPMSEIERLGVDLNDRFELGSDSRQALIDAWQRRQAEIRYVVESMVKPAELMGNISRSLKSNDLDDNQVYERLLELESLVSDIDNARDFHTIGGWPVLVSYLHPERNIEHRALAALTVGTAVKNDFDYQLWTLEVDGFGRSCLDYLTDIVTKWIPDDNTNKKLLQHTLYAISAAARNNIEVQETLTDNGAFIDALLRISTSNNVKLTRKVWAFVSDMLVDTRNFKHRFQSIKESGDAISIENFKLLGVKFCIRSWIEACIKSLDYTSSLHMDHDSSHIDIYYSMESALTTLVEMQQECRNDIHNDDINTLRNLLTIGSKDERIQELLERIIETHDTKEELLLH